LGGSAQNADVLFKNVLNSGDPEEMLKLSRRLESDKTRIWDPKRGFKGSGSQETQRQTWHQIDAFQSELRKGAIQGRIAKRSGETVSAYLQDAEAPGLEINKEDSPELKAEKMKRSGLVGQTAMLGVKMTMGSLTSQDAATAQVASLQYGKETNSEVKAIRTLIEKITNEGEKKKGKNDTGADVQINVKRDYNIDVVISDEQKDTYTTAEVDGILAALRAELEVKIVAANEGKLGKLAPKVSESAVD
jgi:hypothetical protein